MKRQRIFSLVRPAAPGDVVVIEGSEAHHICTVLRYECGALLRLFDRDGTEYRGKICSLRKGRVEVEILSKESTEENGQSPFTLCQAVIRPNKMDYIIQKSTELGVGMIQPFLSHRCIQKWDSERKRKKSDHWNRIILESVKQSGIRRPPVLMPVADFSAIIGSDYKGYTKIILWEQAKSKHLREILHEKDPTKPVIFVIGPEGGFTGDEAERARQYGFETISLGNSILRSETAALAVLSILNYEAGIIG